MNNDTPHRNRFRIGEVTVEPRRNRMHVNGDVVSVEPLVMRVLLRLADGHGDVITRDALLQSVWPDPYPSEASLSKAICCLRKALGDDAQAPTFIETIPRVGYRLIPPVTADLETRTEPPISEPSTLAVPREGSRASSVESDEEPAVREEEALSARLSRRIRRLQATVAVLTLLLAAITSAFLYTRWSTQVENVEVLRYKTDDGVVDSVVVHSSTRPHSAEATLRSRMPIRGASPTVSPN